MGPWYALMAAVFVAWAGVMAYWLWPRARTEGRHRGPSPEPETTLHASVAPKPEPETTLPPGHVLVRAPRIGDFTLRDWLVHRHAREYREGRYAVWAGVVAEFVEILRGDREVIQLFVSRGTNMEQFPTHFLSALLILTHTGLTVGLLEQMRNRHAGLDITGDMFDRTILSLAEVLESKGVPDATINQLIVPEGMVDRLRSVIVMAPAGRAT